MYYHCRINGIRKQFILLFHGVQSYLNNRRIPFTGKVDWFEHFDQNTNVLFDNYLIVILFVTLQALLTFKLYKHYYFKLFACLTIVCIAANFYHLSTNYLMVFCTTKTLALLISI